MPSASRQAARFLAVAACGLVLAGTATGCQTTQEKAAIHQAQSERILEARAERQKHKRDRSQQSGKKGSQRQ